MRNKKLFLFIFIFFISVVCTSQTSALMQETHKAINEHVAQNTVSGFSLTDYLINNLGFKEGTDEELQGIDAEGINTKKTVFKWLGYGGDQEDEPGNILLLYFNMARARNHFHNPLKEDIDWANAGLNDSLYLPDPPLFNTWSNRWFTGQSSVLWSQNPAQDIGGKWSWQDAREYYYSALTGLDKDLREEKFAKTFRAVGQLMHLVEDFAVPQHARNDIHITFWHYEYAVEKMRTDKTKYPTQWDTWMNNPISFNKSILDIPSDNPNADVPIARIIDTDKYGGVNPNPDVTINKACSIISSITCNNDTNCPSGETCLSTIGIAEYANANFLSEDTMFTDGFDQNDPHYFPYPSRAGATIWFDGLQPYFKKTTEGETVNHLATIGFAGFQRMRYFPQYYMYLPVDLDDKCKEDYASLLIPRAVGYSAGLLDYFFRGEVEIFEVEEQIVNQEITGLNLKIKNLTPDEEMKDGEVWIAYQYKAQGKTNFTYGLSESSPSGNVLYESEASYEFTFPSSSKIPSGATDVQYTFVFKGTLGQEVGAVVGKVVEFWEEDWEMGLTGRHNWQILSGADGLDVTAGTVPNPDGTPNDMVAEFKVMTTDVEYWVAIPVAWLYLSGDEGPDKMISTDEFYGVETGFFIKSPSVFPDIIYLEIVLKDPLTDETIIKEAKIDCYFYSCRNDQWFEPWAYFPSGYVVTSIAVGIEFDQGTYFDIIDLLVRDIVFLKRVP